METAETLRPFSSPAIEMSAWAVTRPMTLREVEVVARLILPASAEVSVELPPTDALMMPVVPMVIEVAAVCELLLMVFETVASSSTSPAFQCVAPVLMVLVRMLPLIVMFGACSVTEPESPSEALLTDSAPAPRLKLRVSMLKPAATVMLLSAWRTTLPPLTMILAETSLSPELVPAPMSRS